MLDALISLVHGKPKETLETVTPGPRPSRR